MGETPGMSVPRRLCDHICLLDDGHVERGQVHQYGYEVPSPRAEVAEAIRFVTTVLAENSTLVGALEQIAKPGCSRWSCGCDQCIARAALEGRRS